VLKSSPERCSLEILEGKNFETVAEIELPEYIPFGFHGRWVDMESKTTLETANWKN
jgi:carotenoid cleavage dioxygenase-like enzyme